MLFMLVKFFHKKKKYLDKLNYHTTSDSSSSIIFFVPAQLIAHINKMIKSSYGRNLKRPEHLNDSENNLIVKCSNENRTIQGDLQVFRHCTKCSEYFCN